MAITSDTTTTGRVAPGGSITGLLVSAGEKDWFAINLVAGQQYTFNLDSGTTNGLFDPNLTLYSSDGSTVIDSNDDANGLNSQIDITATATGTYYLEASSSATSSGSPTGSYVLSATGPVVDDYPANATTSGRVIPGGSATGTLETIGDNDWFAVNLVAGQHYAFNLDSNNQNQNGLPDPYLTLYSSDGKTVLLQNDDANGTLNSQIDFTPTTTGTYYLSGSSGSNGSGTGDYKLSASLAIVDDYPANTSTTGHVSPGGSVVGNLEYAGDKDWFAVKLVAGQQYTFNLDAAATNGLPDPYLTLYGTDGKTVVAQNDDTNALNAQVTYTATATGTFYLEAGSSPVYTGTTTGSYTLSASYPSANGLTVITGTSGDDTINAGAGNDLIDGGAGSNTVAYLDNRSNHAITHNSDGTYTIADNAGAVGNDTLSNIAHVMFSDMTINLTVQANAASIPVANLNTLTELYVAFFNRVPDADGLSYWIDQFKGGQSINQIAESFYNAGVQFSSLTGFSAGMSNADFINVFYKNVLGRPDGADAGGMTYWTGKLADGSSTRFSLAQDILTSAHTFKGDATWGWVADLLDNKVSVGKTFAVSDGITYNSSADSITHGMNVAAAVTAADTTQAINLIGVTDAPL